MGKRSELSVAQRREAVLALLRREEPAGKLARRFGVSEQTLHRWRDDFLSGGFADLHTEVYRDILAGGGFGIGEARPAIELVYNIRQSRVTSPGGRAHPLLRRI